MGTTGNPTLQWQQMWCTQTNSVHGACGDVTTLFHMERMHARGVRRSDEHRGPRAGFQLTTIECGPFVVPAGWGGMHRKLSMVFITRAYDVCGVYCLGETLACSSPPPPLRCARAMRPCWVPRRQRDNTSTFALNLGWVGRPQRGLTIAGQSRHTNGDHSWSAEVNAIAICNFLCYQYIIWNVCKHKIHAQFCTQAIHKYCRPYMDLEVCTSNTRQ